MWVCKVLASKVVVLKTLGQKVSKTCKDIV